MIKEELINEIIYLRKKLIEKPNEYISYNHLEGYNKDNKDLFIAKFEKVSAIMLDLGIITEIKSPYPDVKMFEKTNKIHLIDIKSEFQKQESKKTRETLEIENIKSTIDSNKWLLKTKWWPHIISGLTLFWSIVYSIFSTNEVNNLEQRIEMLEKTKSTHLNESKKVDSSLLIVSNAKKDSLVSK
jgi:hypothetical protein